MKAFEKLVLIIIASISLVGCGSSETNRGTRVDATGSQIVNTQPTTHPFIGSGNLPLLSEEEYNLRIREFLATGVNQDPYEIDIGDVVNTIDNPVQGLKVQISLANGSLEDLASVNANDVSLDIIIYDSYTLPEPDGDGLDPFVVNFGADTERSIENLGDGHFKITFEDDYGRTWVDATLVDGSFEGSVYFINSLNDHEGALSRFSIPLN